MFKVDWPCAIGGLVLGYVAKGKVESAKETFKKISSGALQNIKETFDQPTQAGWSNWSSDPGQNGQKKG